MSVINIQGESPEKKLDSREKVPTFLVEKIKGVMYKRSQDSLLSEE